MVHQAGNTLNRTSSGRRPAVRTEFQRARQSIRQRPWHLNSSPSPPIFPPHSGQTQFRMLEITSAIGFTEISIIEDMAAPLLSKIHLNAAMHLSFQRAGKKKSGGETVASIVGQYGYPITSRVCYRLG